MTIEEAEQSTDGCCGTGCDTVVQTEFSQMVPRDKSLSPEWLQSLFERGTPEVYSGDDLKHIGMPVSGICTGQVYLGGDGRLWHWDVFKSLGGTDELIDPRGHHYATPITVKSPIDQGFALQIHNDEQSKIRRLDSSGFSNITFEGRYPIGYVNYSDDSCPLEVALQAFSPFIPLDENSSGLPLTVMEYTIRNRSKETVAFSVSGWLENKVCCYDDEIGKGLRRNTVSKESGALILHCNADATTESDPSQLVAYGNMSLALLDDNGHGRACAVLEGDLGDQVAMEQVVFDQLHTAAEIQSDSLPFGTKTVGAIGQDLVLEPGAEHTVRFAVAWYFPAYSSGYVFHSSMEDIPDLENLRRHYAKQFQSSQAVITHLADNYSNLAGLTRLWVETWYDSTLPYWFLNRTFLNTSTLATQTCHWFDNERFYAWEGVDCCPGTCQHVWQYAQTIARIFPNFERSLRENIDYGIAFRSDGSIEYRAEANIADVNMKSENESEAFFAADGQLGTILRVYREHTMSSDAGFLSRIWPRVKKSLEFMMTLDSNDDGLLDVAQFHTLDTSWHGEIPWISSLYLAALAAGKKMAEEMADEDFAKECNTRLSVGRVSFVEQLFNGEYFVHKPNPDRPDSMDLTEGSYIDQVFGQGYAMQLGLERVIPKQESVSALKALWKYNYTPDVGPYRENFKGVEGGRWYAMPGEGGLLMCTWPKNDCNRSEFEPTLLGLDVTSEGYLNECMSGFEYQVASHMVAEGLVEEGFAITRTIHDRYHPSKRNPWNEVECSDHYSRAMACYGVFLNACGFEYHGPNGHLSFSPKLTEENFQAAFTTAEGWGSYRQTVVQDSQIAELHLKYGGLTINTFAFGLGNEIACSEVQITLNGQVLSGKLEGTVHQGAMIRFKDTVTLIAGDVLMLKLS